MKEHAVKYYKKLRKRGEKIPEFLSNSNLFRTPDRFIVADNGVLQISIKKYLIYLQWLLSSRCTDCSKSHRKIFDSYISSKFNLHRNLTNSQFLHWCAYLRIHIPSHNILLPPFDFPMRICNSQDDM